MHENVPFVPDVEFRHTPVISGAPFNACNRPSYFTSLSGTGRSYTFRSFTARVSASKVPLSVNHITGSPVMSPLSSKVPAPNADGVGADAAGSSARDHRIGFVGTEGSIARSSGAGQLSPIQIPAIARSRAGAAPPSAAAMSSTFVDGDGAGMSLFASLELLSSLVAPTRFPG